MQPEIENRFMEGTKRSKGDVSHTNWVQKEALQASAMECEQTTRNERRSDIMMLDISTILHLITIVEHVQEKAACDLLTSSDDEMTLQSNRNVVRKVNFLKDRDKRRVSLTGKPVVPDAGTVIG